MTEIKSEEKEIELSLDDVILEDKRTYLITKSLTEDFEPSYVLEMIAEAGKNKHYIWRHRHPIDPKHVHNHVYGDIENSWVDGGNIYSKINLFDHTEDHKSYIDLINKREEVNEPLGISMRYRKYYDNGRVVHVDVFEQSGTPIPKCEECGNVEVGVCEMTNEKNEDNKNPKEDEEMSDEKLKQLEESKAKIAELESLLNSKTETLEKLESNLESLKQEKEKVDESLEKKVESNKELKEMIMELEATVTYLVKKPLIDRILEEKPNLPETLIEFYKTQDDEFLEGEYKRYKEENESKPIVKSQEDSANEATDEEKDYYDIDGVKIKKDELFEHMTKRLNIKKGE